MASAENEKMVDSVGDKRENLINLGNNTHLFD